MTREEKEKLRVHVQKNLELLNEVVQHENKERRAIEKNLEEFHKAVDEREKIINAALEEKHAENLSELDKQIEQLKKFISENNPTGSQ